MKWEIRIAEGIVMSSANSKRLALFLITFPRLFFCLEPIASAFVAVGTGAFLSSLFSRVDYGSLFSMFGEHCNERWIHVNLSGLESSLSTHLFGQHLVEMVVLKSLKAHTSKKNPKALVMAFHGWTGSGKNYVSKMIVESLYKLGSKSKFVHWYLASHDFAHASDVQKYRKRLWEEVSEATKECEQSLFIFDEVDKMVPGVIDVLTPFLDNYDHIDGVNYRKNIFIFLSNAGGSEITRIAFEFWKDGKDRRDIKLKDIEPLINIGAFNEKGGLQGSKIIEKNLIDAYVPFLPLEKSHVLECIKKEIAERGILVNKKILSDVINEIVFYPSEFQVYSSSGCKKISHKVDLFV